MLLGHTDDTFGMTMLVFTGNPAIYILRMRAPTLSQLDIEPDKTLSTSQKKLVFNLCSDCLQSASHLQSLFVLPLTDWVALILSLMRMRRHFVHKCLQSTSHIPRLSLIWQKKLVHCYVDWLLLCH